MQCNVIYVYDYTENSEFVKPQSYTTIDCISMNNCETFCIIYKFVLVGRNFFRTGALPCGRRPRGAFQYPQCMQCGSAACRQGRTHRPGRRGCARARAALCKIRLPKVPSFPRPGKDRTCPSAGRGLSTGFSPTGRPNRKCDRGRPQCSARGCAHGSPAPRSQLFARWRARNR